MIFELRNELTIIVNSCDNYSDLWIPFFRLLKKHWNSINTRIILNTETKDFDIEGLDIECIHPEKGDDPYGKRMLNVLSKVSTPYVLMLLDDFFLRDHVDTNMIIDIINWMNKDKQIVYFNCDKTPVYCTWEKDLYPGFQRIPYGNKYTLNMQAAVWRTDKLINYWKPNISPWDWEEYCNLIAARNKKDKFYCSTNTGVEFCDYGYSLTGMGVHHGKWVKDDVVPLFEKEGIEVDYSRRGFLEYDNGKKTSYDLRDTLKTLQTSSDLINRCLTKRDRIKYYIFVKRNKALGLFRYSPDMLYIKYQLLKERKKFIRRHPELLNQNKG